jgi:hypothetical protein
MMNTPEDLTKRVLEATDETSRAAVDAALARLAADDTYRDLAERAWELIAARLAGEDGGSVVIVEGDRDRLITVVCAHIASTMRALSDEEI